MEATIQSAVYSHSFGSNPEVKVHNVVADGVNYQCWSPSILQKIGQKVQFESIPSKDPKYPPRMKLIENKGFGGGGGKSYGKSREELILSSKTMLLSYCKDLIIGEMEFRPAENMKEDPIKLVIKAYNELLPLLSLNDLQEGLKLATERTTGASAGQEQHCKGLNVLLVEIKNIPSMAKFGSWWQNNQESIKALSATDRQILFASKAAKTAEIEQFNQPEPLDSDSIPF